MDTIKTEDNSEQVKKEFKIWLQKYYEDLVSETEYSCGTKILGNFCPHIL